MHPFTDKPEESAAAIGETVLIERIRSWLGKAAPPSPRGPGDDCAVWRPTEGEQLLVTTDPVIHGRHFDDRVSPGDAAAKLLKRNLSDIAAMGGRPAAAAVSLFLPSRTSLAWLEAFHRSLAAEATARGVEVIGGDICATDDLLGASLTLLGETLSGRLLTRRGAGEGDWIAVTGTLGGSLLGKHIHFAPRLAEGEWFARQPETVAMMDISDGLAKDLPAMLAAGCNARVESESVPISPAARSMAESSGRDPLAHAFCDGEDYELLVMLNRATDPAAFLRRWQAAFDEPLTVIGQLGNRSAGGPAVELTRGGQPLSSEAWRGYEHLR